LYSTCVVSPALIVTDLACGQYPDALAVRLFTIGRLRWPSSMPVFVTSPSRPVNRQKLVHEKPSKICAWGIGAPVTESRAMTFRAPWRRGSTLRSCVVVWSLRTVTDGLSAFQ
jgi:hypothetical protein